jgi:hypothetical protein
VAHLNPADSTASTTSQSTHGGATSTGNRSPRRGSVTGMVGRSPRAGSIVEAPRPLHIPIAEGWMRRRAEVNRTWQRRWFILAAPPQSKKRVGLFYFTTREMGVRMMELGLSTEQGVIWMPSVRALRVKTPSDIITYKPPDPASTIIEVETEEGITELMSPEDLAGLDYWLGALRTVLQQR